MSNINEALLKYNNKSSVDEIIEGLQKGSYVDGLSMPEKPIFQEYLINLLRLKSSKELKETIILVQKQMVHSSSAIMTSMNTSSNKLSESLNQLNAQIQEFSKSNNNSANALNKWTKILAVATIVLGLASIIQIFIK